MALSLGFSMARRLASVVGATFVLYLERFSGRRIVPPHCRRRGTHGKGGLKDMRASKRVGAFPEALGPIKCMRRERSSKSYWAPSRVGLIERNVAQPPKKGQAEPFTLEGWKGDATGTSRDLSLSRGAVEMLVTRF